MWGGQVGRAPVPVGPGDVKVGVAGWPPVGNELVGVGVT